MKLYLYYKKILQSYTIQMLNKSRHSLTRIWSYAIESVTHLKAQSASHQLASTNERHNALRQTII